MNLETRNYLEDFLQCPEAFEVKKGDGYFTLKRGDQVWSCPHGAEYVEDIVDLAMVKVCERLEGC